MRIRRKFLLWVLGPAVLLLLAAAVCWQFWFFHPIGSGPAGPAVPWEPFNSTWRSRPVLLVGLGDSVTAGFGARKGYSYFDRLLQTPADEQPEMQGLSLSRVFPNLTSTNLAVSGSTSLEQVMRQLPRMPHADSNTVAIVVNTTGGNDLIHSYGRVPPKEGAMFGATWEQAQPWVANFESRLIRALDEIAMAFPGGCHIFIATIYDPTDGTGDARSVGLPVWPDAMRIHAAYNDVIRRCASRQAHIHLVDLHEPFLGHGLTSRQFWRAHYSSRDPNYWYFVNLEDPNERGYDAIRRLFLNEMVKAREQFE